MSSSALHDLAAILAAACWAFGGILAAVPAQYFGSFAFTRLRLSLLTLLLGTLCYWLDNWHGTTLNVLWSILASGLIGIFLGDTLNFAAMNRLGPRRCGLVFSTHAVFSVLLGVSFLGESLTLPALLGSLLVFAGVVLAVAFARRPQAEFAIPDLGPRALRHGIMLGLLAALCQALGVLLAKPAIQGGMDPLFASTLRIAVSCAAHYVVLFSGSKVVRSRGRYTLRMLGLTAINGIIAMGIGMSLVLFALQNADVATVGMLSALSPVLILPMLWLITRHMPSWQAWCGAIASCSGAALIVMRFAA